MKTKLTSMVVFLVAISLTGGQTPSYRVTDLGTLGEGYSYALGINASGQVVGIADTTRGLSHAVLYSNGSILDLGTLNGIASYASAINDSNQVVGFYHINSDYPWSHPFIYSDGRMQNIFTLSGKDSGHASASAINNSGQVVGTLYTSDSGHAYLYSNGAINDIHTLGKGSIAVGINNSGQVVGTFYTVIGTKTVSRPFLYSNGVMRNLGTLGGDHSRAYGINNKGQVVGEAYTSGNATYHVFIYSDGEMKDLGISGENGPPTIFGVGINLSGQVVVGHGAGSYLYSNGSVYNLKDLIYPRGWKILGANAINDAGQIAATGSDQSGKYRALRLDPLPPGSEEIIEDQPTQPTNGDCPTKEPGKDSLIVVTHGWRPDITWLEAMTNSISEYLISNGLNNWQVVAYKWVGEAQTPLPSLRVPASKGENLGKCIARTHWAHIHFIAHSAGAALIQAATATIKNTPGNTTEIHETFLDAYSGLSYENKHEYGLQANWSDSYTAKDTQTVLTDKFLECTYNVDVTFLDLTHREEVTVITSTPDGEVSQKCYQTLISSHEWPHQFYMQTIPPSTVFGSEGFGFMTSKEAGNWNNLPTQYPVGTQHPPLGIGLSCDIPDSTLTVSAAPKRIEFTNMDIIKSLTGTVLIHNIDSFSLHTGSPVWMMVIMPTTNTFNFLSFQAQFTSTNTAEGLLTTYWGTNVLGSVDERSVIPGLRVYSFPLQKSVAGTHTLGFRLDAFSNTASSVIVSNVTLGFIGVPESFRLAFVGTNVNGIPVQQLTGPSGFSYRVETSTNLVNWSTVAILVNMNRVVRFTDTTAINANTRFYRAVVP